MTRDIRGLVGMQERQKSKREKKLQKSSRTAKKGTKGERVLRAALLMDASMDVMDGKWKTISRQNSLCTPPHQTTMLLPLLHHFAYPPFLIFCSRFCY